MYIIWSYVIIKKFFLNQSSDLQSAMSTASLLVHRTYQKKC